MSTIPPNDPFWDIIAYLNEHNMQGDSRIWHTTTGHQWIYWGRHGWERKMFEVTEWPMQEDK